MKLQVSPLTEVQPGPSLVDDPEIVFHVDRLRQQPADMSQPPEGVRVLWHRDQTAA